MKLAAWRILGSYGARDRDFRRTKAVEREWMLNETRLELYVKILIWLADVISQVSAVSEMFRQRSTSHVEAVILVW